MRRCISKFSNKICLCLTILGLVLWTPISEATNFKAGGIQLHKKITPMRELKRRNIVSQSLDFSCGAAGLSTLFHYFLKETITEEEIIGTLLNTVPLEKVKARRGFSLLDLKRFAQAKGYTVTGYKMDIDFLRDLKTPILVPISFKKYRHFVIVKGVISDRVFIADPAAGNVSMKVDKFQKLWTNGIGLKIEKDGTPASVDYALKVDKEDLIFSDYRNLQRLINQGVIRTTIRPTEF